MQIIFNEVSAGLTFNMKVVSCLRDQGPRPGKTHRKHQGHPIAAVSRGIASPLHRAKKTWGLLGFYPVSFLSKLSPKQVAGGSEDDKSALKPGKDSEKDRWPREENQFDMREGSFQLIHISLTGGVGGMCNQSQSVGWRTEHQSVVISVHVMSLSTMFSSQQHKADVLH